MKTVGKIILISAFLAPGVQAQDSYGTLKNELNQQIDELYPEVQMRPATRSTVRVEKTEIIEAKPEPLVAQAPVEVNQIQVVEQAQAQDQEQVQMPVIERPQPSLRMRQQPLTIVEAAPLEESESDKLRRNRVDYEQETERKLVEKLETDRISDEQRRREKILKKLEDKPEPPPEVVVAPVVEQEPVHAAEPVEPAPVISVVQENSTEIQSFDDEDEKRARAQFYIGLQGGVSTFSDVDNIEPGGVIGASIGLRFPENWMLEFAFNRADYEIERVDSPFLGEITSMEEYAYSLGVRYQFFTGTIRPVGGIAMIYRTRTYTDEQYFYKASDAINTSGMDAAFEGGADFVLNDHFSIGLGLKYFVNLYHKVETDSYYDRQYADYVGAQDTEDLNYWQVGMNLKAYF